MTRVPLPIDPVLPEFLAALRQQASVVLRPPTGAGKTTRVPPAILDGGLAERGRILMLEPRRLAARAAARRMADERGGRLGEEIGYQVRFDLQCGATTRILVVTPGILLRLLHDDPYLESTRVVLFDEFHERGLESDLALGWFVWCSRRCGRNCASSSCRRRWRSSPCRRIWAVVPIVASEGRLFPVEIVHEPRPEQQSWPIAVAQAVERDLERTPGDLLVFLPGLYEIRQTARHLEAAGRTNAIWRCCLCMAICRPSSRTRRCCRSRAARSCWRPTWRKHPSRSRVSPASSIPAWRGCSFSIRMSVWIACS